MNFEQYTKSRHVVLVTTEWATKEYSFYNSAKTKCAKSIKEAAKYFKCRPSSLTVINGGGWSDRTGVYFEEDPNVPNAVKVVYFSLKNARIDCNDHLTSEYAGYLYIHSDGRISHESKYQSDQPRRIREDFFPITNCNIEGSYYTIILNKKEESLQTSEDALGSEVIEMLERQGFNFNLTNRYGWTNEVNKYSNFRDLVRWIINYPCAQFPDQTKEYKTLSDEGIFEPLDVNTWVKVERTEQGVLLRLREYRYSEEKYRILFTNKGACSRQVYNGYDWERDNTKGSSNIYEILHDAASANAIEGELQDLFSENEKFKYLNSWINAHTEELFHTGKQKEINDGIIEVLRLYNNYPILIESLIKLGYFDALIFTMYREGHYDYSLHKYVEGDPKYRFILIDRFRQTFCLESYMTARSTLVLDKTSKDFFGCLGITKFQWKTLVRCLNNCPEGKDRDKWIQECFHSLVCLTLFFAAEDGSFSHYYNNLGGTGFKSLKEISDIDFLEYFNMAEELKKCYKEDPEKFKNALGLDKYDFGVVENYKDIEFPLKLLKRREYKFGNDGRCFNVKNLKQYMPMKIFRKLYSVGGELGKYTDYLRMRQQCMRFSEEGLFHAEDWPEMPKVEYIDSFHDRLVILYNECSQLAQKREASAKQEKWEKRVKDEKLDKFEYEEGDNDRCVILPKHIIELLTEGQKLHHCVGSYVDAVANGKETIIFLRKKFEKETPYATIDVAFDPSSKKWKMRQAHTEYNGDITPEDVSFLKRWAKKANVDPDTISEHSGALCHL